MPPKGKKGKGRALDLSFSEQSRGNVDKVPAPPYSALATLPHTGYVKCVAICDNLKVKDRVVKRVLASGSYENTAKIWDMNSRECLKVLTFTEGVTAIAFGEGATEGQLLTGGEENMVRIIELQRFSEVKQLPAPRALIGRGAGTKAIKAFGTCVLCAGSNAVLIWSFTGVLLHIYRNEHPLTCMVARWQTRDGSTCEAEDATELVTLAGGGQIDSTGPQGELRLHKMRTRIDPPKSTATAQAALAAPTAGGGGSTNNNNNSSASQNISEVSEVESGNESESDSDAAADGDDDDDEDGQEEGGNGQDDGTKLFSTTKIPLPWATLHEVPNPRVECIAAAKTGSFAVMGSLDGSLTVLPSIFTRGADRPKDKRKRGPKIVAVNQVNIGAVVTSVAMSDNGNWIVSGDRMGCIRVWRYHGTGMSRYRHDDRGKGFDLDYFNNTLGWSPRQQDDVKVGRRAGVLEKGDVTKSLLGEATDGSYCIKKAHKGPILSMAITKDYKLVTSCTHGEIKIWDLTDLVFTQRIELTRVRHIFRQDAIHRPVKRQSRPRKSEKTQILVQSAFMLPDQLFQLIVGYM